MLTTTQAGLVLSVSGCPDLPMHPGSVIADWLWEGHGCRQEMWVLLVLALLVLYLWEAPSFCEVVSLVPHGTSQAGPLTLVPLRHCVSCSRLAAK